MKAGPGPNDPGGGTAAPHPGLGPVAQRAHSRPLRARLYAASIAGKSTVTVVKPRSSDSILMLPPWAWTIH